MFSASDSLVDPGVRVARLNLEPGPYRLQVRLHTPFGVLERRSALELDGPLGVTFVFQRSCLGIECNDEEAEQCLGGICQPAACSPEQRPQCEGMPACAVDGDCAMLFRPCAVPRCVDGLCYAEPDDSQCAPHEYCGQQGCLAIPTATPIEPDAGAADSGHEALPDAELDGSRDADVEDAVADPDAPDGSLDLTRTGFTAVARAEGAVCAVRRGEVWCQGSSQWGVLRNGAAQIDRIDGIDSAVELECGGYFCCAQHSGRLTCWGRSADPNQLAADSINDIPAMGNASNFALSRDHACAIVDGAVWCWGDNTNSKLGYDGPGGPPSEVIGLPLPAIAVTAAVGHSCAVLNDGRAFCWGSNFAGRLGVPAAVTQSTTPVEVEFAAELVELSAAHDTNVAFDEHGQAFTWGGSPVSATGLLRPLGFDGVSAVASGLHQSFAIQRGLVIGWGASDGYNLGRESTGVDLAPSAIPGVPSPVVAIAAGTGAIPSGGSGGCAIAASTELFCWGANTGGEVDVTQVGTALPATQIGFPLSE